MTETILTNAILVLPDEVILRQRRVRDGSIAEVQAGPFRARRARSTWTAIS